MGNFSVIKILADLSFVGANKKLPVDWKTPTGDPALVHYGMAFATNDKNTPAEPMCYFWPATLLKLHTETCKEIGGKTKDFCHKALDAVATGINTWKAQAKFKDLKVMAVSAIGTPGCLDGPKLKDVIVLEGKEDNEKAYCKAVKEGISECWEAWQGKVTVPGLPWYPAFAAFPGPTAPPMPNVPVPLIACPSAMMSKLTGPEISKAMQGKLDKKVKDADPDKQHVALFDAIGACLAVGFLIWVASQMVMNVLGKGPVPAFAPPYVPLGPVVGGDNVAVPGHIAA